MMMAYLMSLVLYLMTLSSDVLDAILSLEPSSITQFPYILSAIALIVLSGFIRVKKHGEIMVLDCIYCNDYSNEYVRACMVTKRTIMVYHTKNTTFNRY